MQPSIPQSHAAAVLSRTHLRLLPSTFPKTTTSCLQHTFAFQPTRSNHDSVCGDIGVVTHGGQRAVSASGWTMTHTHATLDTHSRSAGYAHHCYITITVHINNTLHTCITVLVAEMLSLLVKHPCPAENSPSGLKQP